MEIPDCITCDREIKSRKGVFEHPFLEVTICKKCSYFLDADDWTYDENTGKCQFCRCCGQGGDIFTCDNPECKHAFCMKCLQKCRIITVETFNKFIDLPDDEFDAPLWHCVTCSPSEEFQQGQKTLISLLEMDEEEADESLKKKALKKTSTKTPTKKDPKAPKRPLSSYMIFANKVRAEIKSENPNFSLGEVGKKTGKMWGELDDEDKEVFTEEHNKLKSEYERKMKNYTPSKGFAKVGGKVAKAGKDPNAPKRPLTSFMIFANEMRAGIKEENPDFTLGQVGKRTGEMWKDLSDDEKEVYVEKNKELKELYEKKMENYAPPKGFSATGSSSKKKVKDPNAPKGAQSAYFIWMNANRSRFKEENPDAKVTDIGKIAGAEWREMDDEEKEEWSEKAKKDKERYARENEKYSKSVGKSAGNSVKRKAPTSSSVGAKSAEYIDDSDDSSADGDKKPAESSDDDNEVASPVAKRPRVSYAEDDEEEEDDQMNSDVEEDDASEEFQPVAEKKEEKKKKKKKSKDSDKKKSSDKDSSPSPKKKKKDKSKKRKHSSDEDSSKKKKKDKKKKKKKTKESESD